MKRVQFWIAAGVVLLAVAFVGWKSSRPPKVEVVITKLEDVTLTLAASGVLESAVKTTVSSQLNGALVRDARVDIGSRVKAGDILVVLDAAEFEAHILKHPRKPLDA
jgi:multidrug efflux pump subunit AcrA (membrane-fusion protein)